MSDDMKLAEIVACAKCNGKGVVLVNLNKIGFGTGFHEFMSAGTRVQRNDDGSVYHELVCPQCEGKAMTTQAKVQIVLFDDLLSDQMKAHVLAGGVALEKWDKSYTYGPHAPRCFRGKDFVKLYDQDEARLIATARRFGVNVIKVDRPGQVTQHIDLIAGPMAKALAEAVPFEGELTHDD